MKPGMTVTSPEITRAEIPGSTRVTTAPDDGCSRVLNIDQIQPYEHNPRLLQNPKWREIEASILASGGLTQALAVTKRPGDDTYTVHQGGNTRLRILKKLYDETADACYRQVRVEVHPYTSEFDLAALHDRENVCRGDLTFMERAWSKFRQFELFGQEAQCKTTARAFIAYLGRCYGDTTTAETFSRMKFAVEVLYQHIPTCLVEGGMSESAVRHLITIRAALERIWLDRKMGSKADFGVVFFELLARQDRDLADTFATPDRDPAQYPDKRIAINWDRFQSDFCHECTIQADGVDHLRARAWVAPAFLGTLAPSVPAREDAGQCVAPARVAPMSKQAGACRSADDLRGKALGLARELATAGGFGDAIEAAAKGRFGYRLVAAPSHEQPSALSKACWWALVVGLGEANQGPTPSAPSMGHPSATYLSEDLFLIWADLLKVHAHLIASEGEMTCPLADNATMSLKN